MKNGSIGKVLGLGAGVLVFLLLYVGYHSFLIDLGYRIQTLQNEEKKLRKIHHELMIEVASLSALDRIEKLALKKLDMVYPTDEQIVLVKKVPGEDSGKVPSLEDRPGIWVAETKERTLLGFLW